MLININNKIGLGTVQFGMNYGISNSNGQTSILEVTKILNRATQLGINIIDTASAYGNAQAILGEHNLQGFRVVSKFMPPSKGLSLTEQFNDCLKQLRIDSLYGYLAHRPMDILKNRWVWDELKGLKLKGKISKIGFSLNSPDELEQLLDAKIFPDIVQVPYNYFDDRFKDQLIKLKLCGCEIHSRSTFLQGLFFMDPKILPAFFDEVREPIQKMQSFLGSNISAGLLRYVVSLPFIDCVIIGVENEEQLMQNLQGIESAPKLLPPQKKYPDSILMPSKWAK